MASGSVPSCINMTRCFRNNVMGRFLLFEIIRIQSWPSTDLYWLFRVLNGSNEMMVYSDFPLRLVNLVSSGSEDN